MAYQIQQGDIVQITMVTHMPSVVKMLNTYHYRYVSTPIITDGRAAIATLLTDWSNPGAATTVINKYLPLISQQAVVEEVWGQKVYPIRYAKVVHNTNHVGQLEEEPLPALAQWSIMKKGELAERSSIGGNRYSGLGESFEAQGQLTGAAMVIVNQMAANTILNFTDTASREWEPIVYRRLTPGVSSRVFEARSNGIISTQRTRVSFRGI